jgi:glycosyltransferase involved in cell wall biosynthesis
LKRIVEETHSGLVFSHEDQGSFVEAVCRLADDPNLCRQLGEGGYDGVKQKYNWSRDAKVLIQCYSDLAKGLNGDFIRPGRTANRVTVNPNS